MPPAFKANPLRLLTAAVRDRGDIVRVRFGPVTAYDAFGSRGCGRALLAHAADAGYKGSRLIGPDEGPRLTQGGLDQNEVW